MKKALQNLHLLLFLVLLSINATADSKNSETKLSLHTLNFTENKGQILNHKGNSNQNILFKASATGMTIYLGENGLTYLFTSTHSANSIADKHQKEKVQFDVAYHRVNMTLLNANKHPEIRKENKNSSYQNYYIGANAITNVSSYNKIIYQNIYPHIDWVIYSNNNELKYDFIVHKGGNPSVIKIQYTNFDGLKLNAENGLDISSSLGKITEEKPFTYQENHATIKSSFVLQHDVLSFSIANYDNSQDLIIDPGIIWSTYFGGTNGETGWATKADLQGNAYMAGTTGSVDLLMDTSYYAAFDTISNLNYRDTYLAKFDASGNLLWATYYGGASDEISTDIAITPDNKPIVVGFTWSTDLHILNAFQASNNGPTDAFLAKFNEQGYLERSSYFGSNNFEQAFSIATDYAGNIYFGGSTQSSNGIAFGSGFKQNTSGGWEGYVVKLDSAWVPQWSSYYGGTGDDEVYGISIEPDSAFVFITGYTNSSSGLDSNNVIATAYAGGKDAFLARLNFNGALLNSCYFGGAGDDVGNAIDCQPNFLKIISVAGTTNSSSGIANANQVAIGGGTDAFLGVFRYDLTVISCTYHGGLGNETGEDVVDNNGGIFICGMTNSSSGVSNTNGFQQLYGGYNDGYVAGFMWFGMGNMYSSYYGSGLADQLLSIDEYNGGVYVTGESSSYDKMCFGNSYQNTNYNPSGWTAVFAKFAADCNTSPNTLSISTSTGLNEFCLGSSLILNATGANNLQWTSGPSGNNYTITQGGQYEVSGTAFGCPLTKTITITANPTPSISINPTGALYVCEHDSIQLIAQSSTAISYQWYLDGNPINLTNDTVYVKQQGNYSVEVYNASNCNKMSFPVNLFVNSAPPAVISAGGSTTVCQGASVLLTANNSSVTYQWLLNGNPISGAISSTYTANATGNYSVKEISPTNCDSISNSIHVEVIPYPNSTISYTGEPYTCTGNTVLLHASQGIYSYQWLLNGSAIANANDTIYTASQGGAYNVVLTNAGICSDTSNTIEINPAPLPVQICMATVDSLSHFNNIMWEKPVTTSIDSFRIYREDVSNIYKYIASVGYHELSLYVDTDLTNANPNAVTKRYKLATVDICGNVSNPSNYHNTIYMISNNIGSFFWNLYQIENEPNPVSSYILYRDDNSSGNWNPVQSTAGTQTSITDPTYFNYPNSSYRIETNWGINCNPTAKTLTGFSSSKGNIKNRTVGIKSANHVSESILLVPNPAENFVTIYSPEQSISSILIFDNLGREVMHESIPQNTNASRSTAAITLDIEKLAQGIYVVQVTGNNFNVIKKMIVNK